MKILGTPSVRDLRDGLEDVRGDIATTAQTAQLMMIVGTAVLVLVGIGVMVALTRAAVVQQ